MMNEKRFELCEINCFEYGMEVFNEIMDNGVPLSQKQVCELLNELHEEVMDLGGENTKFKLIVSEIIEDMQKYVDENQLVYINQSYVDWIKKEVDTTLYSQKKELEE